MNDGIARHDTLGPFGSCFQVPRARGPTCRNYLFKTLDATKTVHACVRDLQRRRISVVVALDCCQHGGFLAGVLHGARFRRHCCLSAIADLNCQGRGHRKGTVECEVQV